MNRIAQLRSFLAETPGNDFLTHALALEYIKANDDQEALSCFRSNLDMNPDYVATYYHLGKLLERTGVVEEAIAIYERGMEVAKKVGDQHAFSELRSVHEELTF